MTAPPPGDNTEAARTSVPLFLSASSRDRLRKITQLMLFDRQFNLCQKVYAVLSDGNLLPTHVCKSAANCAICENSRLNFQKNKAHYYLSDCVGDTCYQLIVNPYHTQSADLLISLREVVSNFGRWRVRNAQKYGIGPCVTAIHLSDQAGKRTPHLHIALTARSHELEKPVIKYLRKASAFFKMDPVFIKCIQFRISDKVNTLSQRSVKDAVQTYSYVIEGAMNAKRELPKIRTFAWSALRADDADNFDEHVSFPLVYLPEDKAKLALAITPDQKIVLLKKSALSAIANCVISSESQYTAFLKEHALGKNQIQKSSNNNTGKTTR